MPTHRHTLLALATLTALCHPATATEAPRPVRVQTVSFAPRTQAVTFTGTVQPRVQASLGFRVAGKVTSRRVDIGQRVTAGQILAQLDPTDARLNQDAAEQAVKAAQADAINARAEFDRYQRLGKSSPAYIASEYDKRQAALDSANARLAQAERQLGLARDQLAYTTLTADADGIVTSLNLEAGQVVTAGQTVLTLAHSAETEVAVDVPENRLPDIRSANAVSIRLWSDPDHQMDGRVREIGALADPASRTFAVKVSITDPGAHPGADARLGLGMTAIVRFGRDAGGQVARLPASAVVSANGTPSVWVLDGPAQRVIAHPVTIADWLGDGQVEITAGVPDGAQVVTAGAAQLDPDMAVKPWAGAIR